MGRSAFAPHALVDRSPPLAGPWLAWHARSRLVDKAPSHLRPVRKLVVLADAVVIVASLALAVVERPLLAELLPLEALPQVEAQFAEYVLVAALALPLWLALVVRLELHTVVERAWSFGRLVAGLIKLHVLGFVCLATLIYATQVVVNRSLVGLFFINTFGAMLVYRALLSHRRQVLYRRGIYRWRLLLVGKPGEALRQFVALASEEDFAPEIVGYLDGDGHDDDDASFEGVSRLGGIEALERVLHDEPVDRVLFFPPYDRADRIEAALLSCETVGVPALLAIDLGTPTRATPELSALCGRPFVSLDVAPKEADRLAIKHMVDFVVAVLALLLLWPLLLLISVALVVTSGRPVFFVQERAGYRGRPFRMLKFRTMVQDAEQRKDELLDQNEVDGAAFKIERDPRVTRLGRLLRRTSMDELPQLLHVLTGTMSIVGPRPLPLGEQQKLKGWHRRRLSMRPGLTGLWQVSGRSSIDFDRWMELDLEYVDSWSLWFDLKIVLKTIPVVLLQKGAW